MYITSAGEYCGNNIGAVIALECSEAEQGDSLIVPRVLPQCSVFVRSRGELGKLDFGDFGAFPVDSGWRDRVVEQREAGSVKTAKSGKFHTDWRILAAGLAEPA